MSLKKYRGIYMLKTINKDDQNGDIYCVHGLKGSILLRQQFSPNVHIQYNSN